MAVVIVLFYIVVPFFSLLFSDLQNEAKASSWQNLCWNSPWRGKLICQTHFFDITGVFKSTTQSRVILEADDVQIAPKGMAWKLKQFITQAFSAFEDDSELCYL